MAKAGFMVRMDFDQPDSSRRYLEIIFTDLPASPSEGMWGDCDISMHANGSRGRVISWIGGFLALDGPSGCGGSLFFDFRSDVKFGSSGTGIADCPDKEHQLNFRWEIMDREDQ